MIDILLSTYNGEKYLAEQIESLLNQTYTEWTLTIRDDGSNDGTISIIEKYAAEYPDKIKFLEEEKINLGYIKSFERLLQYSSAEYIMFCDQDDCWLSDKIELSINAIKQQEYTHGNSTPILVHTDLYVTDEKLNIRHESFARYSGLDINFIEKNIHYLGICNTVTGCATLFNKALKETMLPFNPSCIHDEWAGICAKKYGILLFIPQSTILYRQHGKNSLGAVEGRFSVLDKIKNIKKVLRIMNNKYRTTKNIIYTSYLHFLYYKILYTFRCRINIKTK